MICLHDQSLPLVAASSFWVQFCRQENCRHLHHQRDAERLQKPLPGCEGWMQSDQMRRREFITLLGGASAWPVAASAQHANRVRRIGMLLAVVPDDFLGATDPRRGFPAGAAAIGLDHRPQRAGRHPLGRESMLTTSAGTRPNWPRARRTSSWPRKLRPCAVAATATRTVPIVFVWVADLVGAGGYVDSLSRPGGNTTGFMQYEYSLSGKWLELLKEIAPRVTRVAVLRDPRQPNRRCAVRCNPVSGAAARGRGEPGHRARPDRDRARRHGLCALREWRSDP